MSRLPRPHSSPESKGFAPSLKRKVVPEEDDLEEQPAKKGSGFRPKPLQASTNTATSTSTAPKAVMPRPLTRPRPPAAARPTARGASAPPVSTVRKPSAGVGVGSGLPSRVPSSSTLGKRTASGTAAAPDLSSAHTQLQAAHTQLAGLQAELGAAQGALRAREDGEAALRAEVLALKGEVLAGKTALAGAQDAAQELRRALARQEEESEIRVRRGERLLREAKEEVEDREARVGALRAELAGAVRAEAGLQERCRALAGRAEGLGGEVAHYLREKEAWASERAAWEEEKALMRAEAVRGEEERRRLHGMVMELKGNIRVFCRVRPVLPAEGEGEGEGEQKEVAQIAYPDAGLPYPSGQKEIVLSSTGAEREWDAGMGNKPRREVWGFGFDRVFTPSATQADLFAEISQLAQSCTDGYNVCIFAYGQTGSGKSWTMEGGGTEETQGMIPRAVAQVFRVAEELKDKGWTYTMEGQFLEIYNETITDLLAPAPGPSEPAKKHEIHHDPRTHQTRVADVRTPALTSPSQVLSLLAQAQGRRRVAATLMNERSSRSHSVFTLRIRGTHAGGEEERVGALNLVDLAGSERLATVGHGQLGASTNGGGGGGERLKETQSINRSLSALGDVVAALGSGPGAHVPYRNSKLTYLLQNSLSGNSKTLMVLNLSPLAAHLSESLTSLRFATKVNNTTIGTARKVPVGTGTGKA
ncbi:kinesin-domain-containing protein [Mycena maculata]|uniref:Kinesin-domain-containing protein n=1 Tax=Mycena maculata TaxID=230809 RepID=A0AAD7N395_9AGAR|nr:kinesin-domain-containing protein [Mycena maculata]